MIKLNNPTYSLDETINLCIQGITGNPILREKVIAATPSLSTCGQQYQSAAETAQLYKIAPLKLQNFNDPDVVGSLKKSDLEGLYTLYFSTNRKPARVVYDAIKNAAKERCPFCGGIGTPRNIDHFLPKAHFPQYSVLPLNLVPSCRDCNMDGKGHAFATVAESQIIHPYLDRAHFFDEQWIHAIFHEELDGEPGYFTYYVQAPETWPETDKERALKHFQEFDIANRYAKQAAEELGGTFKQIQRFLAKNMPKEDIVEALLEPKIQASYFCNHWRRPMYQALKKWLHAD